MTTQDLDDIFPVIALLEGRCALEAASRATDGDLAALFPQLKTFATLSPIPGYRPWLTKNAAAMLDKLDDKQRRELGRAVGFEPPAAEHFLSAADRSISLDEKSPIRQMLLRCAAHYIGHELQGGAPIDPVARFHLGNGARVERMNWAGDPSA